MDENQANVTSEQTPMPQENAPSAQENQPVVEPSGDNQAATYPTDELYKDPDALSDPQAEVAPEPVVYDFEGVTSDTGEITNDDITSIRGLSEELKLSNEQARNLLSKSGKYIMENLRAKQNKFVSDWIGEIKTDPQLGGANFKATQANLNRAMRRYGGQDALKVLSESGLGAHPAIVRMLNAIGKDLGEEQKFVNSKSQAPKPKNPYRSLYNNSPELNFGD